MLRALAASLVLVLAACGSSGDRGVPQGVFEGDGGNRLTLDDPNWTLQTGIVTWTGTYRIEGSKLILSTADVQPPAGHGTDCLDSEETYDWRWEGEQLRLSFDGEPCNRNRGVVLMSLHWTEVN